MTDTTEASPDLGHNNPPSAIDAAAEVVLTAEAFIVECPEILDADQAKEAGGLVEQLRAARKTLTSALKSDMAPHDQAIADLKAEYKPVANQIDANGVSLMKMSSAWLQKERARIAAEKAAQEAEARRLREEADRIRREAEEAARDSVADASAAEEAARAAAEASAANRTAREAERVAFKKPEAATIKGDTAKRAMRLTTYWSAVVTDEAAAIETYRDHPTVRAATLAAALKVANEAARVAKSETAAPAGFRFVKDERAS